jgi:hypothetical protein
MDYKSKLNEELKKRYSFDWEGVLGVSILAVIVISAIAIVIL